MNTPDPRPAPIDFFHCPPGIRYSGDRRNLRVQHGHGHWTLSADKTQLFCTSHPEPILILDDNDPTVD